MTIFWHLIRLLVILVISWLLPGCAQIASPSGGKKDNKPPSFVKAIPKKGATGVRPGSLRIYFDEFINLQNTRQNVLFSPPIKGYDLVRRKRSVEIQLPKDSLKDSTTHTIQFGSAIKDITEGNALKGFEYVFSTGSHVDSLSLNGSVVDAYTLDSVTDVSVLLYRASSDNTIQNSRPYYYTEVGDNGGFSFDYLQEGEYHVYALKDLNNNLQFDPGEKVGFKPKEVSLKKDTTLSPLRLFQQQIDSASIVKTTYPFQGVVNLTFNQKIDTFEVAKKPVDSIYWNLRQKGKKGEIFFYPSNKDSLTFILKLNKTRIDTAIVKKGLEGERKLKKDTNLSVTLNKQEIPAGFPFVFTASHPVQKAVDSSFGYVRDSVIISKEVKAKVSGKNQKLIKIKGPFRADSTYKLRLDSGAIRDIYGNRNKPLEEKVKVKKEDEYGLLEIQVTVPKGLPPNGNVILEIRNKEGELIRRKCQKKGEQNFLFAYLTPGSYRVKGIIDVNGNGFWDEGNLFTNKLPEEVFYLNRPLKVKPNWEVRDLEFKLAP